MQSIEFLGAVGGEVTGSSYLVTSDSSNQILVDFGMFQGLEETVKKNYLPLAFSPSVLQAVFLTHGHLDHCGRLPLLVYGGFKGRIFMTAPTREFVEILLQDSARVAEKDLTKQPLYSLDEVNKLLQMITVVEYNKPLRIGDFEAIFKDAGHILGSASIELVDISSDRNQKIVFSGDLGNTPQTIVKPTEYIDSADFVVMESTYGNSSHSDEDPAKIIQEEINAIEQTGGVLLIPAFAIERTQEVLHIIHHLKKDGKVSPHTPVYLDSPLGIDATLVYMNYLRYANLEINSHQGIPFNFEGLVITDDSRDSKDIINGINPKVIIAGSGMMAGGRIIHHVANYIADRKTRILFVGYQGEETMGRSILDGAKSVLIDNKRIPVHAHIRYLTTLSSHADQPLLLKWLNHIQGTKKVFLTHGEDVERQALAKKIKSVVGIKDVFLPDFDESFEL